MDTCSRKNLYSRRLCGDCNQHTAVFRIWTDPLITNIFSYQLNIFNIKKLIYTRYPLIHGKISNNSLKLNFNVTLTSFVHLINFTYSFQQPLKSVLKVFCFKIARRDLSNTSKGVSSLTFQTRSTLLYKMYNLKERNCLRDNLIVCQIREIKSTRKKKFLSVFQN